MRRYDLKASLAALTVFIESIAHPSQNKIHIIVLATTIVPTAVNFINTLEIRNHLVAFHAVIGYFRQVAIYADGIVFKPLFWT